MSAFCRPGRELNECDERCVTCGHACAEQIQQAAASAGSTVALATAG